MGERRGGLIWSRRGPLARVITAAIGLDENPAAVIYGVITVGAVLAAEGSRNETYARSVSAAVLILLLYWVVHAWSTDSGDRIEHRRPFRWPMFADVLGEEWSIMRGAVVPIVAVLCAGAFGATDRRAVFVGTIVAATMLVVIEFASAVRNRLGPRQVAIQTAAGAAFGFALIALRFIVH